MALLRCGGLNNLTVLDSQVEAAPSGDINSKTVSITLTQPVEYVIVTLAVKIATTFTYTSGGTLLNNNHFETGNTFTLKVEGAIGDTINLVFGVPSTKPSTSYTVLG